jgi:signal transduction histidine kinase/ligand-binding sensor domain-containing protein/DNA-binding response OmpR family regulator
MRCADRIRRSLMFISFLILCSLTGYGQEKFFSTLSIRDGLPTNLVNAIAQDKNNFIWVATGDGLARFDGYRFRVFKKEENTASLPGNEVQTLFQDGDNLWVGTRNGLCVVNTITFNIKRIELGTHDAIRCILKDRDNIIWVGTTTGLIRYDRQKGSYRLFSSENSKLSHNTVRTIYQDQRGYLWAGTYNGLNKLDTKTFRFTTFDLKRKGIPPVKNNLICDIRPVAQNDSLLWIGTDTGLCRFNTVTGRNENFPDSKDTFSNEVVKAIYTDRDGSLWLGTDFGLNIYQPETGKNQTYFHNPQVPYSLVNNVIWQIFEDNAGVLWFVTSNGISRINQLDNLYQYHHVTHQLGGQTVGNQVKSFIISKSGIYWIGTLHGVIRYDPATGTSKKFDTESDQKSRLLSNNVGTLREDREGRIWIGTVAGINVWDEPRQLMHIITASGTNGLVSNYINNFIETSDGSLLVGTWEGGIFKAKGNLHQPETLHFERVSKAETEKFIYAAGAVWLVEFDELFRLDLKTLEKKKITSFSKAAERKTVSSFFLSKTGILWAATQQGLIEYNPQNDKAVFHAIPHNNITRTSITEDQNGHVWTATNTALEKFIPSGNRVEFYPLNKNLPLKSFYSGCVARSASGMLFFGGDNGYVSFSPEKAVANRYQPKVFLTNLLLNNESVNIGEKINDRIILSRDISFTPAIELDYGQRSLELQFAALHFWQPEINMYSYKLEGADENWHTTSGQKNFAVYSNLSPGTYVFKVKGTNNNGIWSSEISTTEITVNPPFFLGKGFIVLYVLLIGAGIYFALRAYSARIKLENELKISKLEIAHAEEIEQTKEQFFTNISHELRTPISLILPPIHQVMKGGQLTEENQRLISLAEKNSNRLLRVVNQILDFKKMQSDTLYLNSTRVEIIGLLHELYSHFEDKAVRHDITYHFQSNIPRYEMYIDPEKTETIVLNLLSNAFKFTPKGGKISLSACLIRNEQFPEGALEIEVSDTGTGISAEDQARIFERFYQTPDSKKLEMGSGIGLALSLEYVKMHKGEIRLKSAPGEGSCFTVCLPAGDDSLAPGQDLKPGNYLNRPEPTAYSETNDIPDSAKPLLLIVEDNPDMIDFIRISLKNRYRFIVAGDGAEGLQKAQESLPDVIISDIMMPVMDGLTFCKKIKSDPKTSQLSIILLTARSLTSQKIEGIRTGADAYITKPFDIELLDAQIANLLLRKTELSEYFRHELIITPLKESSGENMDDKFVNKVMNIIEANISDPDFSVEALSSEIGMSSAHLSRKLKSLTHFSANEIIKKYRIKKASLLLQNREGNISEVMYDVGFSNLSYFSKCFRDEFGDSPKEYLRKMGKKFNMEEI